MLSQRTFPQGEDGTDDFLFAEKNSLVSYGYNIHNLEKARGIDPFGHAGFDPSGKIRLTL